MTGLAVEEMTTDNMELAANRQFGSDIGDWDVTRGYRNNGVVWEWHAGHGDSRLKGQAATFRKAMISMLWAGGLS